MILYLAVTTLIIGKPVFLVSVQDRFKPNCLSTTKTSYRYHKILVGINKGAGQTADEALVTPTCKKQNFYDVAASWYSTVLMTIMEFVRRVT